MNDSKDYNGNKESFELLRDQKLNQGRQLQDPSVSETSAKTVGKVPFNWREPKSYISDDEIMMQTLSVIVFFMIFWIFCFYRKRRILKISKSREDAAREASRRQIYIHSPSSGPAAPVWRPNQSIQRDTFIDRSNSRENATMWRRGSKVRKVTNEDLILYDEDDDLSSVGLGFDGGCSGPIGKRESVQLAIKTQRQLRQPGENPTNDRSDNEVNTSDTDHQKASSSTSNDTLFVVPFEGVDLPKGIFVSDSSVHDDGSCQRQHEIGLQSDSDEKLSVLEKESNTEIMLDVCDDGSKSVSSSLEAKVKITNADSRGDNDEIIDACVL